MRKILARFISAFSDVLQHKLVHFCHHVHQLLVIKKTSPMHSLIGTLWFSVYSRGPTLLARTNCFDFDWHLSCVFLSDAASQFVQHCQASLQVLGPAQPERVLVFHDVGQHGAAQEHHVLTPGRVLDADLKLLQKWSEGGTGTAEICFFFFYNLYIPSSVSVSSVSL